MSIRLKIVGIWLLTIMILTGCRRDNEKNGVEQINGVEGLTAASAAEAIVLSWKNPAARLYDKVDIWYFVDGKKEVVTETIEEEFSQVVLSVPDENVYKFYVQASSSVTRQLSEIQSVKGRMLVFSQPQEELEEILNSVVVYGGAGGIRLLWDNPGALPASIRIDYEDGKVDLEADRLTKEYTIDGLREGRSYMVIISMVYDGELTAIAKNLSVIPEPGYAKLRPEDWSIIASSTDAHGGVVQPENLLDGDPHTYWQSQPGYPHHVIIDLQRIRKVAAITLVRKFGDSTNSSWDNNISLSKDGVNYRNIYRYVKSSPDPNPIFSIEFNRTIEGEQLYMLPAMEEARYIRVDMVRGSGNRIALFGDINVYGE
ncbi:discoidin domain-containing protein [Sphingobacterium gobiense]|uniref:F5/8 type C domain-containing protein n=1 Tax=Sphingobacterium gobiense TaxID=1382456 RepID=A0A2S9JDF2_9SPHI|nr:discoidin domain-containing protein [Sphingobacterium gobiense]PRD50807.1 hypothetical protein C5749_19145 [Sphingobacterium gobiense]